MIRRRPSQELVVLVTYTVGLYMTIVDNTIIYTALPSLARDFHASLASAQWVTLSYLIMLAMMIPSSGWIGDRFGTRRTFLIALALFTGASALCGLSGSHRAEAAVNRTSAARKVRRVPYQSPIHPDDGTTTARASR